MGRQGNPLRYQLELRTRRRVLPSRVCRKQVDRTPIGFGSREPASHEQVEIETMLVCERSAVSGYRARLELTRCRRRNSSERQARRDRRRFGEPSTRRHSCRRVSPTDSRQPEQTACVAWARGVACSRVGDSLIQRENQEVLGQRRIALHELFRQIRRRLRRCAFSESVRRLRLWIFA